MSTNPPVATRNAEEAPLLSLDKAVKRFARKPDLVERLVQRAGLAKPFPVVHAVDGVDIELRSGEVVGLVGESGCGKSTLGRMLASITPPTSGDLRYRGQAFSALTDKQRRRARLDTQMIFQNPYASLNPRARVNEIVGEAAKVHGLCSHAELDDYVSDQLDRAGLDPAYRFRYPHQFSGGQRARIGIARALAVQPRTLVCDEAVAALDVSIQAQIINLFMQLRETLGLTYLFISHDLGVVEHLSDRVVVMYLGRVVEQADVEELFSRPNHPYSQALLAEMPRISTGKKRFSAIRGEIPSPLDPPSGCHFHPRCPYAHERCQREAPALKPIASGHLSACHLNDTA